MAISLAFPVPFVPLDWPLRLGNSSPNRKYPPVGPDLGISLKLVSIAPGPSSWVSRKISIGLSIRTKSGEELWSLKYSV